MTGPGADQGRDGDQVTAQEPEVRLTGRGVADGIAIGPALFVAERAHEVYRFLVPEDDLESEVDRLNRAVEQTRSELLRLRKAAAREAGSEVARVFEAHDMMLTDPLFLGRVEEFIQERRVNAEWAIQEIGSELLDQFRSFETEHLRARGQDLLDVMSALSGALEGIDHHRFEEVGESVIVVADELTPSEMIHLHEENIGGVVFRQGGTNSHAAIVARALQIPMVVGVESADASDFDATPVLVDGGSGMIVLHPSEETVRLAREQIAAAEPGTVGATDPESFRTADGERITLRANVEFLVELDLMKRTGAEGVGLYRSEFLYLQMEPEVPTEEDHYQTFRALVEGCGDQGATIRTFDLGGRDYSRVLFDLEEGNPALGMRGIRLTLRRLESFRVQLRAIVRAAQHGSLRVMMPLVSNHEEIIAFKSILSEVEDELRAEGHRISGTIPVGAMIEVPAAALIADELAAELDFLSIGTNDLVQYTLAVDRNNEHVADLYQPLHPAVLRLLSMTIEAAARHEVEVSLCGEIAADPMALPILLGLGLRVFSATPQALPRIQEEIRKHELADCRELAERALRCRTAAEVEALLQP